MKKISKITGKAIPLAMSDVDTDLIIPAQYLTSVSRSGYGENLFRRLREKDINFVFNQEKFNDAKILITLNNFGCGSSREHAVWALLEAGIEAVIAISFSDIFFSNSSKNGLMLIQLPEENIKKLLCLAEQNIYSPTINIEDQTIISAEHDSINFHIDPFRKYCFVNGLDELDYLLNHKAKIHIYEEAQKS